MSLYGSLYVCYTILLTWLVDRLVMVNTSNIPSVQSYVTLHTNTSSVNVIFGFGSYVLRTRSSHTPSRVRAIAMAGEAPHGRLHSSFCPVSFYFYLTPASVICIRRSRTLNSFLGVLLCRDRSIYSVRVWCRLILPSPLTIDYVWWWL